MFEFITLFCTIDDFFQKNEAIYWQYLKQENPKVRQRSGVLCLSEIIFIAVWYKNSQLHHFKAFYGMIQRFYYKLFKALPSYQRMVHLINQHQLALQALHISLLLALKQLVPGLILQLYPYVRISVSNVINL